MHWRRWDKHRKHRRSTAAMLMYILDWSNNKSQYTTIMYHNITGFGIMCLAQFVGPLSGGHINCAVSFALFVGGRFSFVRWAMQTLFLLFFYTRTYKHKAYSTLTTHKAHTTHTTHKTHWAHSAHTTYTTHSKYSTHTTHTTHMQRTQVCLLHFFTNAGLHGRRHIPAHDIRQKLACSPGFRVQFLGWSSIFWRASVLRWDAGHNVARYLWLFCFIFVLFLFYSCFILVFFCFIFVLFLFYFCFIFVLFLFYFCFIFVLFCFTLFYSFICF